MDDMRTSISHPLQIAGIFSGVAGHGRVGITFCPGKYDPNAMAGPWNRDLSIDLDALREWGAAALVTLLEPREFKLLRVQSLGEEVSRRNIKWFHLPIVDTEIPDASFEREWNSAGADLLSILRRGSDVVVHCRGGLGRAGTIASRLLIELGMEPRTAIAKVRAVRPGAIENDSQKNYVLNLAKA